MVPAKKLYIMVNMDKTFQNCESYKRTVFLYSDVMKLLHGKGR